MKMRYPVPPCETWEDVNRLITWCELRKFNVWFRSTHHQAATPKSVFVIKTVLEASQASHFPPTFLQTYEIIFESDDCAIEYRLRFL